MSTSPEKSTGLPWQQARQIAAARLDALETQWRAAGIDPAQMDGVAGPIACYASQEDFAALRPEDTPGTVADHGVIVRATVQEARRRYGLRLVPINLPRVEYLAWLGTRQNSAATRAEFLATRFAQNHFEP